MMMIICRTHFRTSVAFLQLPGVDMVVQKGSYININECLYTYAYICT